MLRHADRAHARTAAAVRDAERLVQVEMADVGADVARPAEADHRVHVRAVHVDLAAVLVHDLADLADRLLEHAVRRSDTSPSARRAVRVFASAFARRSATSMLPFASVFTTTTFIPAITALAGLVPCADCGIRHTLRCASPRDSWYARITSSPAYSPCEPAFGCSDTAAKPVISASARLELVEQLADSPAPARRGANGCSFPNSGHVTGIISAVAFSFIVQRAERDHRVREREVARLERAHVAQHLRLGVVRVEHRDA